MRTHVNKTIEYNEMTLSGQIPCSISECDTVSPRTSFLTTGNRQDETQRDWVNTITTISQ